MTVHNLLYLIIVLLIVSAFVPYFSRVEYPVYAAPSLWTVIALLVSLRLCGII